MNCKIDPNKCDKQIPLKLSFIYWLQSVLQMCNSLLNLAIFSPRNERSYVSVDIDRKIFFLIFPLRRAVVNVEDFDLV